MVLDSFSLCSIILEIFPKVHLEEWGDLVETFKETHVTAHWGRFVAYVVWLKQFPLAAEWYFRIEENLVINFHRCRI